MNMNLLKSLALAATFGMAAAAVQAEQYPSRPVTLVVPFPAGGITDNVSRWVARKLSERMGQAVIVENKPGAGGSTAAERTARATPDGYTLFVGTQGTHATDLMLYKDLKYDPIKDFIAIHSIVGAVNVLVVNPSRPYTTVGELIAYAKKNPGKINYASSGTGTATHLTAELFQGLAGIHMTHVPYKGSAPALTDLLSGTVDLMFDYPASTQGHIKTGKLRALAVTYGSRLAVLPNVPTIAEAGLPGAESLSWAGIFVPAKTPRAVVDRLTAEMEKIMADPETIQAITGMGGVPFSYSGPKFQAFVASEMTKWQDVIKRAGVASY
jgi:tripartite-type tricarboxylate transporter receptor subunit TctC